MAFYPVVIQEGKIVVNSERLRIFSQRPEVLFSKILAYHTVIGKSRGWETANPGSSGKVRRQETRSFGPQCSQPPPRAPELLARDAGRGVRLLSAQRWLACLFKPAFWDQLYLTLCVGGCRLDAGQVGDFNTSDRRLFLRRKGKLSSIGPMPPS